MRCRRCSMPTWRKAAGGRLLLRIEDIDETRCRPEYEAAIYEDLAWLGLALGAAGAAAIRALRRLPRRARQARRDGAHLSELRKPRRDRGAGGRPRTLAARSRRRAALSRRREIARACRARPAHGGRRALCAAPRHAGGAHRARRSVPNDRGWKPAPALPAKPARSPSQIPQFGATSSWRARKRRPAIIWPWWWTTRRKASPTWCAGATCSTPPACTVCCRRCSACPQPRYHHHRLILDADGRKLSKSTSATGLRELRAAGVSRGRHPPPGRARLSAASVALSAFGVGDEWRSSGPASGRERRRKTRARARAR